MEGVERDKIVSLSISVKVLLENHVFTLFADNLRRPEVDVSFLQKLKKTLLDLEDVLCYGKEKLIPNPSVSLSLDLLTFSVFQLATLFQEVNNILWYDTITRLDAFLNINKQIKTDPSLKYCIDAINSKTQELIEILPGFSSRETPTSSILDAEYSIYGRDCDIEKLKDLLLSNTDGDSKIRIISIVGMGGIGKTTLAKHLYNHPQVKANFELTVWVDFSKDQNDFTVFENILESTHINTICPHFLLVLDGVWDATTVNWRLLLDVFNAGETPIRVIITTRDERAAQSMQPFLYVHYLTPLKDEDCWYLLAEHAFTAHDYHQQVHLQDIGWKIAKQCDGLPLAAVALGAILRISLEPNFWNYVLESKVRDATYEVQAALKLSYSFLSDPLK